MTARKTSKKAASAAAKVLRDTRSTNREKSAAASALAQVEGATAAPDDGARGEDIMRHFRCAHLPAHLQAPARRFSELAHWLLNNTPRGPERSVALRKLLEGKDAAVRAAVKPD
jgi:hypothetical protein